MNTVKQSFCLAIVVTLSTTTITAMITYNPLHTYHQLRKKKLYVTEENSSQIIIKKSSSQNKKFKKKLPRKEVNYNNQNQLNKIVPHANHINVQDKNRLNAYLHWATHYDHIEIANKLLQNGADVNVKDYTGSTPLHIAIRNQSMQFVHLLLGYEANPTLKDKLGHYPDYYVEWCPCGRTPLEGINKKKNKFALDSHPVLLHARLEKLLQEQQKK